MVNLIRHLSGQMLYKIHLVCYISKTSLLVLVFTIA